MKKIPTLFERVYENHKIVGILPNVTDGMEWVLNGEGVATIKFDGSCCANGFSTEYYRDMREKLDKAEWEAKFQQRPFVREGILFESEELRYFNGILPELDHRIVAVTDVALGGGDSLSMPIGAEYENGDVYIFDWVFNKGKK